MAAAALLLASCGTPKRVARKHGWQELSPRERSDRLTRELGLDYRYIALPRAVVRFIELPASQSEGASDEPEPAPIVFVHGIGGGLGDFAPLMLLARGRARLVALDLPGFGGSFTREHDYTVSGFAKALAAFLERLQLAPARLACHSLGGQICLALALAKRELIHDMTLVAPAGVYNREEFVRDTSRRFGISTGKIAMDDPSRSFAALLTHGDDLILRKMVGNDPVTIATLASFRENLHDRLTELTVPLLVIWGKDDNVLPMSDGFALATSARHATLRLVEGARHSPQLTHPEKIDAWMHARRDP